MYSIVLIPYFLDIIYSLNTFFKYHEEKSQW